MKIKEFFKNVGIVTIGITLSRVLGLAREIVIANRFGTTAAKDAYEVGSYIPITLSNLLVAGIFSAVFIPLFTKYIINKKKNELKEIISVIINQFTVLTGVLIVVFFFLSKYIIKIQAPFFDSVRTSIAVNVFQIALPSILFLGIAAIVTGALNSLKMFGIPTLGGIIFNFSVVLFVIIFSGKLGINSIAYGLVIGSVGQLFIQYPWLHKNRLGYKFTFKLSHPGISDVYLLMLPVLIGSGVNYLAPFIERFFGSSLSTGMISALGYSFKISQFPIGIFALAISSVVFPSLSENVICKDSSALAKNLTWALKFIMLIIIPATIGLIALSYPITRLLFQSGQFVETSTRMTSIALSYYSLALLPWSFTAVMVKIFYSNKDTKTPVYVAIITIIILFVSDYYLVKVMDYRGLALGSVIAAFINMIILWIISWKKFNCFRFRSLGKTFIITSITSLILFVFLKISFIFLDRRLNINIKLNQLFEVGLLVLGGIIVYFVINFFFNRKDLKEVLEHGS